jgi:hypothetical protein
MKFSTALKLAVLGMVFAVVPVVLTSNVKVAAHGGEKVVQADDNNQTKQNDTSEVAYSYVAQPGDSYSLMSRKAVQTYGLKNKVNLSQAQIIYTETHLTQSAGSHDLNVGEKVSITESTIKSWVDKAQKLSDADEAAWNYYVQFANFNTNSVGQST